MLPTTTRKSDLAELSDMLRRQHVAKRDLVLPIRALRSEGGRLVVRGSDPVIDDDGVTRVDGTYNLMSTWIESTADRLSVPTQWWRRMHTERPDIYDEVFNRLVHGGDGHDGDGRTVLARTFSAVDGTEGLARAMLSDRYRIVDNLDVLMAALAGVRHAGANVTVDADLTEHRMIVRIGAPEVQALAPDLLAGYRSPWTGARGDDNPVVFAGFVLTNSEVGAGAWTLTPRVTVEICSNGFTISRDAIRGVHIGRRQEEGVVRWSDETRQKELELVTSRTADAVRTFLDVDYIRRVITEAQASAGTAVVTPEDVTDVTKPLTFTADETRDILGHFIRGGQTTIGGVAQAITAAAQDQPSGDRALHMETAATGLLLGR